MKETWVSVYDGKECDTCHDLHNKEEDSEYWDRTGRPNERPTICVINGFVCRCILIPRFDIDKMTQERNRLIDQAVNRMFTGIKIDLGIGGRAINLKEFEQIQGIVTASYASIEYYENLIWTWKRATEPVRYLPDKFYQMANIKKQTAWLKGQLRAEGITGLTDTRGIGGI